MGNDMSAIWEILKITIPALLVFLTAYLIFRDMLEKNYEVINVKINSLDEEVKIALKEIVEIYNNLDKLDLSS